MSLNTSPSANRIHIGIFGKRNAGKSSVINAITGQDLAIVSPKKGTTTDPVQKAMELLPLGPVVIIDTPGLDDDGDLGELRVEKAYQVLRKVDIALLVIDATLGVTNYDLGILEKVKEKKIPVIVAINKYDLLTANGSDESINTYANEAKDTIKLIDAGADKISILHISTKTNHNIDALKDLLAKKAKPLLESKPLVKDLITQGDFVILVTPIDESAPKGRLILPQQQVIREIIDCGGTAIVVQETKLQNALDGLKKAPALVITDSQVFKEVDKMVPAEIPLTSFSILFARYKGNLEQLVRGTIALDSLNSDDHILISEGCTHHRQCNDIGSVKLPNWIESHSKRNLHFHFTSGTEFPDDLSKYKLVIHCGGCVLNEREMQHRLEVAKSHDIPMTNYGTAIAHMHGILKRSLIF